jgi:hypothetical protein
MTTPDMTEAYHNQVRKFFEETAPAWAKETGFVRRRSPLDGRLFLLSLMVTVYQQGTIVLEQLAATAEAIDPRCQVTGQAFAERFTAEAVQWLQALTALALQLTTPEHNQLLPLLSAFRAVYLLDSSTVRLPETLQDDYPGCGGDGSAAALKLYLLLDWLSGAYETVRVEAGRKADQNMGPEFVSGRQPGALWLFDLGFFNLAFLAAIAQAHSYFLCRLKAQVVLSVPAGEGGSARLELDRLLHRAPREVFELAVLIGAEAQVPGRLICAPVPPEVAQQRRRRARENARRQGYTPSQVCLRRLDWVLLVTDAPLAELATSAVVTVARVRWQVELAFKLAKSEAALQRTHAWAPQRVRCEFYAKLIALLFFNRLAALVPGSAQKQISPAKAWRRMRSQALRWLAELNQAPAVLGVRGLVEFLARHAKAGRPKQSPTTVQQLEEASRDPKLSRLLDPLGYLRAKSKKAGELAIFWSQARLAPKATLP